MKKKDKMQTVMDEFKAGKLRSGSKDGPKVENRKQAIAIGLNQSGKSRGGGGGRSSGRGRMKRLRNATL